MLICLLLLCDAYLFLCFLSVFYGLSMISTQWILDYYDTPVQYTAVFFIAIAICWATFSARKSQVSKCWQPHYDFIIGKIFQKL